MQIYPIRATDDRIAAFEVSNLRLGRRGALRIVQSIPGATIIKKPRFFSWPREDVFLRFALGGTQFEIEEPYGDNSRYWIGPAGNGTDAQDLAWHPAMDPIRSAFEAA